MKLILLVYDLLSYVDETFACPPKLIMDRTESQVLTCSVGSIRSIHSQYDHDNPFSSNLSRKTKVENLPRSRCGRPMLVDSPKSVMLVKLSFTTSRRKIDQTIVDYLTPLKDITDSLKVINSSISEEIQALTGLTT